MEIRKYTIAFIKRIKNKYFLFSLCSAMFLSITSYYANNLAIFTGEDLDQLFFTQMICDSIGIKKQISYDEAVFVNISYDKDTVPAYFRSGKNKVQIGTNVVTDRKKLCIFLKELKKHGRYKYVLMDLTFDRDDKSPYDDDLFGIMSSMDNFVFVDRDSLSFKGDIANKYPQLRNKASVGDYYSTITATNFARYQYLEGESSYMPLKVYHDIDSTSCFKKHKLFGVLPYYTDKDKLCNNSVFLLFDSKEFAEVRESTKFLGFNISKKNYFHLGNDFVRKIESPNFDDEDISDTFDKFNGKYVVIGNIKADLHDTYLGLKPGSLILFRALQTLQEGKHYVNPWLTIFWFIIYFIISLLICTGKNVLFFLKIQKSWMKAVHFIADNIWYIILLWICQFVEYVLFDSVHSLIVLSILIPIIRLFFQYKDYQVKS